MVAAKKREVLEHPISTLRDEVTRLYDYVRDGNLIPEGFPFARAFPSVDVTETPDSVIVTAEVPGLETKDLDLSILGNSLIIKGERKEEHVETRRNRTHHEMRYGAFSRSIPLPGPVKWDGVVAECRKGVLTVTLPKPERETPRKISVKGE